jgi:hypothetical protein
VGGGIETMNEPIPSPFNATPIEDEVYLAIDNVCKELGISAFFFAYGQEAGNATDWHATTNYKCEELAEKLEEAADAMRE